MNQRDRKITGAVATGSPGAPATVAAGLLRKPPVDAAVDRLVHWEELFRHASPAQRENLLTLARRQGFLYAHQVPAPTDGKKPATGKEGTPATEKLTRLLEGVNLPPVRPQPLTAYDEALDRLQREAVARALATPDVCLIAGLPGTGKSRVAAEILTQAALRGQRVLFLAPRAIVIDLILEQISQRDILFPFRCLEAGERPEALPSCVRSTTFAERLRKVREVVPGALQGKEAAEQRCQRRRQEEPVWPALRELTTLGEDLEHRRQELRQQQARIPGEVSAKAAVFRATPATNPEGTFAADILAEEGRHQETLAEITAALNQVEQTTADSDGRRITLEAAVRCLQPLAAAKQRGRWWTLAWWRALFRGNVSERLADRQSRLEETCATLAGAREEAQILHGKRQELEKEHQHALGQIQKKEVNRRLAELAAQEPALEEAGRQLDMRWHDQIEKLDRDARPATMTSSAVETAHQRWQVLCKEDEDSCVFARQWASTIQETADILAQRLPALANVVAGTMAGFLADKHFAQPGDFDLLLLEDAHKISEPDFLKIAGHARRWILIGEPPWECPQPGSAGAQERMDPALLRSRAPALWPLFHRLWHHFDSDLRRLPYAWSSEGDRLCCRLKPIRPEHRQWLECERVADCPEIELRIVSTPGGSPVLAEVVFPPSYSIHQAKEFIFKQLEELAIQPAGRHGCWLEETDRLLFCLGGSPTGSATMVTLAAGVCEALTANGAGPSGWRTSHLEFDKTAGWRRESAEAWLQNRLRLMDTGRTLALLHPYRMQPELAAVLSDVLFGDRTLNAEAIGNNGASRAVVFVPVPSLRKRVSSTALPKEGAGLELDLTATRGGDRLPANLRAELPGRGIVNYYEAQALVRHLEKLIQDPVLVRNGSPATAAIGVVALYASQVELIRLLCRRSPVISKSSVALEIGQPGDLCHREFPLVLCSLTRSHGFRAVSLGDEASALLLALTRARARLMVFGDPGTLVRRSHWQGRLDHLDEHAALREAQCVTHLVQYLQGQGAFASAFHVDNDER